MTDNEMRLRLVVRRHGIPEARFMWNVRLENDPTIARLLEQLNEDVPLEGGQWGMEDYVVELHDDDGTNYECLHFQSVRSLLKPDDRVFVRPLDTDDHRRRRISGRHQISSDGKHLIDGVPFGRPRLKAPRGRPPIHIPPLKRPRLTYHEDDAPAHAQVAQRQDTPMLFLTNGENSSEAGVDAGVDDADSNSDGQFDYSSDGLESNGSDSGSNDDHVQDIEDLQDSGSDSVSDSPSDEDLGQEARDLAEENDTLGEKDALVQSPAVHRALDLVTLDKLSALRTAFPSASVDICEKVLITSDGDTKAAYAVLAHAFAPQISEAAALSWPHSKNITQHKRRSTKNSNLSRDPATVWGGLETRGREAEGQDHLADGDGEEDEDDEARDALVRQYDHRGLPPGSITSGRGLTQMAAISASFTSSKLGGDSAATSATLDDSKKSPEKTANKEDDDTSSSSGTTSSSESEKSEQDSDDASSSRDQSDSSESSDSDDSDDSNDSDSDSDDEGDSIDDDTAEAQGRPPSNHECESDESSGADSGPEQEKIFRSRGDDSVDDVERDPSFSGGVSDEISSSESHSESDHREVPLEVPSQVASVSVVPSTKLHAPHASIIQGHSDGESSGHPVQSRTVPPGAGKDSTKSRNARRRAAKKARRLGEEVSGAYSTTSNLQGREAAAERAADAEDALFQAKRKALLDAISNGGVEIGVQGHADPEGAPTTVGAGSKRKREEQGEPSSQAHLEVITDTPEEASLADDSQSSISAQKRRRVDLGAGRRLLFGALGLRTPKSKEDEEKLRTKLMKDVRPIPNPVLGEESVTERPDGGISTLGDQDPSAWKDRITYRAVECCSGNVHLTEPPFPFVQRWDPQQQGSWPRKQHKRGSQSKRAQRNQAQYYHASSRLGKKRSYEESADWDGNGFEDTFNGIDDAHSPDAGIQLNYDDEESRNRPANDVSQFTDIDDLPSLPRDLSALPILRPGQARAGMVITWRKWSCSSSTNWQPQLSNVTAVVVRIDDDATGLEVCLAKRDRHLDATEKHYDHHTGQRIYDRFEAPDLDEEDDDAEQEDEGFRTLSFAEMQEPRVLQEPLSTVPGNDAVESGEIVPSIGRHDEDGTGLAISMGSVRKPHTNAELTDDVEHVRAGRQSDKAYAEKSEHLTYEPTSDAAARSLGGGRGHGLQTADASMSNLSQISSPTQQLQDTISQSFGVGSPDKPSGITGISGETGLEANSSVVDCRATPERELSYPSVGDSDEADIILGTPNVMRPRVTVPSFVSSVVGGRQPDYGMETDNTDPFPFGMTSENDHGVSPVLGDEGEPINAFQSRMIMSSLSTPRHDQTTASAGRERNKTNGSLDIRTSPADPSSPGSLSSINTIWCTALTSRNTQSQSKSQALSAVETPQTPQALRYLDYNDAMRKLDKSSNDLDDSSSEVVGNVKGQSRDLDVPIVKECSLPPQPRIVSMISPPQGRRRSSKQDSQSTIPPGTKVPDLSSDSEPSFTENYADEEVDETYSPRSGGLPGGNGWIEKKAEVRHQTRSSTASLGSQPRANRYLSTLRGRKSASPSTSDANVRQEKSRRKTSARF